MDWNPEHIIDSTREKRDRLIEQLEATIPWNIRGSERSLDVCSYPITATAKSEKGRLITEAIARHETAMRFTRRLNIVPPEGHKYSEMISQIMAVATVERVEQHGDVSTVSVNIAPEDIRELRDEWGGQKTDPA